MTPTFRAFLCFLVLLSYAVPCTCRADEPVPGLVGRYDDGRKSISVVTPTPHFTLEANDSIHPRIDREFTAEWTGLLRVERTGDYRFKGSQVLLIDGREVTDRPVRLSADDHPIVVRFRRKSPAVRHQLRWESNFFAEEPIPSSALFHSDSSSVAVMQQTIDQGRLLYAEYGCGNCHGGGQWKLNSRRGPDLGGIGQRVRQDWLMRWLENPHEYRTGAVMPISLSTARERADMVAYLMSDDAVDKSSETRTIPKNAERVDTGRSLVETTGCLKCHDQSHSLAKVRTKFLTPEPIVEIVADPHRRDPAGRMPQLFDPASESHRIQAIAEYLFHGSQEPDAEDRRISGNAEAGRVLFASRGCANCHTISSLPGSMKSAVSAPLFAAEAGLPLRHFWDFEQTVQDAVASNHGKVIGKTAFGPGFNDDSTAIEFDGSSFVELSHFQRPDRMTISAWVQTTHGGSLITWGRPGGGLRGSRELRMNIGQDGRNSLCYGEYNSDGGWRPVTVKPSDVNLIDEEWHHVAVVRNGQEVQHFIDGQKVGKPGRVHDAGGNYTDRLLIGALGLSQAPGNRFRGRIDDLSLWDAALNEDLIRKLAAGDSPLDLANTRDWKPVAFSTSAGCLSQQVTASVPDYRLDPEAREALRAFLDVSKTLPRQEFLHSPIALFNLRIQQYRCTACHELNDINRQAAVEVDDDGRIVRVERPPLLTGAGDKLTPAWLNGVLREHRRNRPWLNLRMPHFGTGVDDLPRLITKSSGASLSPSLSVPDRKLGEAGNLMIGERRGQVSCIACHNYRGINRQKDGVVPAPDLAEAATTVRADWFQRWMHNPSRLQPGTSMPQLYGNVSSEQRDRSIEQLWAALVMQRDLPLPRGLIEQSTEGTRIVVRDRPVLFRMATITPVGQIDRAINVGVPGGLNYTFDAVSCSLRYAWSGDFLDAGPAWNGRGGNPVRTPDAAILKLESPQVIRIGTSETDQQPRFGGYRLVEGRPIFRYTLGSTAVEVGVQISDEEIVQSFSITQPDGDVFFTGADGSDYQSDQGVKSGSTVRIPAADTVKFMITIPNARQ